MKKLGLFGLIWGLISLPFVSAQEYMFTYSNLFSQAKHNASEEYSVVKVGFFFVDSETKQLCTIEKAWMENKAKYEELTPSAINELVLPLDNNLRQANPLIFVDLPERPRCDYSTVVMARNNLANTVSYQEIAVLLPQMQSLLEKLGGSFAHWFTPKVTGVTLEFAQQLNSEISLSNGQRIAIVNGIAQVELEQIGQDGWMQLPQETQRVLPYLPKAKR